MAAKLFDPDPCLGIHRIGHVSAGCRPRGGCEHGFSQSDDVLMPAQCSEDFRDHQPGPLGKPAAGQSARRRLKCLVQLPEHVKSMNRRHFPQFAYRRQPLVRLPGQRFQMLHAAIGPAQACAGQGRDAVEPGTLGGPAGLAQCLLAALHCFVPAAEVQERTGHHRIRVPRASPAQQKCGRQPRSIKPAGGLQCFLAVFSGDGVIQPPQNALQGRQAQHVNRKGNGQDQESPGDRRVLGRSEQGNGLHGHEKAPLSRITPTGPVQVSPGGLSLPRTDGSNPAFVQPA